MPDATLRHATAERLRRMVDRGCAWPDERGDIKLALDALKLDPADPDVDHPLIDLYRALLLSARTSEMMYLSAEHKRLLTDCVDLMTKP